MVKRVWVWLLMLCSVAFAAPCPAGQAKDGSALVQNEQTWAKALEQRDSAALSCLLAVEFEDAGPDGTLLDRDTTLAKVGKHQLVHHELTEMHPQVHGDFGYIRGLATAVDATGKVLARVRFTDIYVYRDGRWQAVAAHESMLAETP
ncbi:MAG: nuclear transport factor 2 family protein [Candidatus Sulfotelmatobacter sp.]